MTSKVTDKAADGDRSRHSDTGADSASPACQARIHELEGALESSQNELLRTQQKWQANAAELGHYRELFDFAPVPLLVLNRAGIIEQINLAAAGLLGAPRANIEGRPLLAYVISETKGILLEHLRLCRAGNLPARAELALRAQTDSEPIPVEIHSHCRERSPQRLFATLIDMTDRNRAEAERHRTLEIEAQIKAQDQFLALVSHELRTPISPIANLVEVLQMRADLPESLRPILEIMHRNVWMEVRLIDDLLDITRIRRNKLTIEKEPVDLHGLLRNVEEMLADDYRKAEITLDLQLQATQARINADPTRINQVFWNLLGNALKFTPAGGHVSVQTRNPQADRIRIAVQDTGPGMEPEQIERLFRPFEQVRDGFQKGLGLGLAIAQGIIERHDGTLCAHSDGLGKGARFTVTLPLAH